MTPVICYLYPGAFPSSAVSTIQVLRMCEGMLQAGYKVTLICQQGTSDLTRDQSELKAFYGVSQLPHIVRIASNPIQSSKRWRVILSQFGFSVRAVRCAQHIGASVLYTRDPYTALVATCLRASVILEEHAPPNSRAAIWIRRWIGRSHALQGVVYISQALSDIFTAMNIQPRRAPQVVAHDAASLSQTVLDRQPTQTSSRQVGERLTIGYVGSVLPGRGIELILSLARNRPQDQFVIVGGPADSLPELRQGAPTNLRWRGVLPPAELTAEYAAFDLLLMPYQPETQTRGGRQSARWMSPLKLFEYMASGVPIISSDLPVLREVLVPDYHAMLVPAADVSAWTMAVERLAGDPPLRAALAQHARQAILDTHNWLSRASMVLSSCGLTSVRQEERRAPRLLFVAAFPPPGLHVYGGIITGCRSLMQSSFPARIDVIPVDSTQRSNPPPSLPMRAWYAIRKFIRFVVTLEREKPDVAMLFTSSPILSTLEKGVMARYASARGVPVVMFPRGGQLINRCERSDYTRRWVRWLFRSVCIVLCQGEAWQRFAVNSLGFKPENTRIIPNWTAREDLLALGRARSFVHHDKPLRLLFAGWLEHNKGVMELLEACHALREQHSFHLTLAGDGHAMRDAQHYVAEHSLRDRVTFSGWLGEAEMKTAYQQADILVLPSWAEGLPNVVIEAMAAGLAVVVTAVGNIPATFADEHHALMIPPHDVRALTASLDRVMSNPDLRENLARQGHDFVARTFAVEPAADRLVAAIEAAVARKPRTVRHLA